MSDAPSSFEVQVQIANKWHTDSVFDDRALAEDEAIRALEGARRPQAVRVVRESVNPNTDLITSTTVFRRTQGEGAGFDDARRLRQKEFKDEQLMNRQPRARPVKGGKPANAAAASAPASKPRKKSAMNMFIVMLVLTTLVLVGGMMALVGLHSALMTK